MSQQIEEKTMWNRKRMSFGREGKMSEEEKEGRKDGKKKYLSHAKRALYHLS